MEECSAVYIPLNAVAESFYPYISGAEAKYPVWGIAVLVTIQ